jgi:hypothetical protein
MSSKSRLAGAKILQQRLKNNEAVEKPASERLMENVHMQGFRNPEE